MKKFFLMAVMLLTVTSLTFAQERGNRQRPSAEESAKAETEWMTKELKLTEKQVTSVNTINLETAKAQQKLRESASGDFSKVRESMQALQTEKEKSLAKVLSSEQMETYKKKVAERRQNRGNRGEGRGNRGPGAGGERPQRDRN